MWVPKAFNTKTNPIVESNNGGGKIPEIVIVNVAALNGEDLLGPTIDGVSLKNGFLILTTDVGGKNPRFVKFPQIQSPSPLSIGSIVVVTEGSSFRNHLFITIIRNGELQLETVQNTGGVAQGSGGIVARQPPAGNRTASALVTATNELAYIDTANRGIVLSRTPDGNGIFLDLGLNPGGNALEPMREGLMTFGINLLGLHLRTCGANQEKKRWVLSVPEGWFWMAFGAKDIE